MYLGMMVFWAGEVDSAAFELKRRELF